MHHKYQTEAFVIGGYATGEAHRTLVLLTPLFGIVHAEARSVRHLRSRLRFALSDLSLVRLSLIKGKSVWRIASAVPVHNAVHALRDKKPELTLLGRLAWLTKRLSGEEANHALFHLLKDTFLFLVETEMTPAQLEQLEHVVVLRMLHNLGYVRDDARFRAFCANDAPISIEELQKSAPLSRDIVGEINRALSASQL